MAGRISSGHPHRLMVEGKDFHAIIALARRHGLEWDGTQPAVPYAESADGKENLLPALPVALKAHHRLGVVLDADLEGESPAQQTWIRAVFIDV